MEKQRDLEIGRAVCPAAGVPAGRYPLCRLWRRPGRRQELGSAARKALLLALRYPGIRLLLLRRGYPELRENHILPLRALCGGAAEYKESQKALAFCNGSRLKFGDRDTEGDVLQYQGQEYDVIFIDEATQFTEFQFSALTACFAGGERLPQADVFDLQSGGRGPRLGPAAFCGQGIPGEGTGGGLHVYPGHGI